MSEFEAEYQEQSQAQPDRADWLGGEALVSFHRKGGPRIPLLFADFGCNGLILAFAFAAGFLIGSHTGGWRRSRAGAPRRRS
jgi:hypothetical protein